jgi:hypothetical protein
MTPEAISTTQTNDATRNPSANDKTNVGNTTKQSITQPINYLEFQSYATPWEALVIRVLFRLTKQRNNAEPLKALQRMTQQLSQRQYRQPPLDDTTTIDHLTTEVITQIKPFLRTLRPTNQQIGNIPRRNRNRTNNTNLAQQLPRPLKIYESLETFAALYNYAIFEPICSHNILEISQPLLDKCIEYWFTSHPVQHLPNYHCTSV